MSSNNISNFGYLYRLNSQVTNLFVIVYSSIGIPCNILSIIIFYRLTRIKNNMGFLYICQSVVDIILFLINLLLVRSSPLIFPRSPANLSDELCKIATFLRRISLIMSAWMTVLITFDRFIFIFYKRQFKLMQDRRFLVGLIFLVFVVLTILDIPNFFFYLSTNRNVTFSTFRVCIGDFEITVASDIISVFMRTYIPFVIMFVLNIIMIRKIMESSRASLRQTIRTSRKDYQFTISVMFVDVYIFLTNLPESIFYIIYDYYFYSGSFLSSPSLRAYYTLMSGIFASVSLSVQTFSFFSYLAFNRVFRHEFRDFFGKYLKLLARRNSLKPVRVMPIKNKPDLVKN